MPSSRRWYYRWQWIQPFCIAYTCLATVFLTAPVSADNIPYDLHYEPCSQGKDQDWDAPCKCGYGACKYSGSYGIKKGDLINVAYNRPIDISTFLPCTSGKYCGCSNWASACGVVNGFVWEQLSAGCCCNKPRNGASTLYEDRRPWLWIDLQRPYTISYIVIKNSVDADENNANYNTYRLANTMELVDAKKCHEWPSYDELHALSTSPNEEYHVQCQQPIRGTHIRLQKKYESSWFMHKNSLLVLGEVMVWVCPSGFYGYASQKNTSCTPCPTNCSFYFCDNLHGCKGEPNLKNVAHNIVLERPAEFSSGYSSKVMDGLGATFREDMYFCYASRTDGPHSIRFTLDGIYLVTHVVITTLLGYEFNSYSYHVLVVRAAGNSRLPSDEVCWAKDGPLGVQYGQNCVGCSSRLGLCPRGRFVKVIESRKSSMAVCEIEAFGVAVKESSLGQPCAEGASCKLVYCEKQLVCNNSTCKVPLGYSCASDADCEDPATQQCSAVSSQCRLRVGQNCTKRENLCHERLQCDVVNGKCALKFDENCSSLAQSCHHRYVCDYSSHCRIRVDDPCKENTDCVIGAVCNVINQCQCSDDAERNQTGFCVPKTAKKCQSTFKLGQDFSCRLNVGENCNPPNGHKCDDDAQCINNTCRANFNARCDPTRAQQCGDNSRCDPVIQRCRTKVGKPCNETYGCVQGTSCQQSNGTNICLIRALEECQDNRNLCVADYACNQKKDGDKWVCMLDNGRQCDNSLQERQCPTEAVCVTEAAAKRCMQDVKQTCHETLKCREGAECNSGTCRWRISHPCNHSNGDECGAGRKCDADNICRIKKGESCTSSPAYCQLRASCIHGTCKCVAYLADDENDCPVKNDAKGHATTPCLSCDKKTANDACIQCSPGAICNNNTGMCECLMGNVLDDDLTCRPDIGAVCSASNISDLGCARGSTCDGSRCTIPLGQSCLGGNNWLFCKSGTVCDTDGLCRLDLNHDCSGDRVDLCLRHLRCDAATRQCKMPVGPSLGAHSDSGPSCHRNLDCVSGAYCDESDSQCYCQDSLTSLDGSVCKAHYGLVSGDCASGSCSDTAAICEKNKCVCKEGFEVSPVDLVCKIAEGERCVTSKSCGPEKQCDIVTRICKRKPGSPCNSSRTDAESECTSDATCEEGKCILMINANCLYDVNACPASSFCESGISNRCKYYRNAHCNYTTTPYTCLAGAKCVDGTCQCDLKVSTPAVSKCNANMGMVFGLCSLGQTCEADGAVCGTDTNICTCQEGSKTDFETLSCEERRFEASKESTVTDLAVFVSALVLLVLFLIVLAYRKIEEKKKALISQRLSACKITKIRLQRAKIEAARREWEGEGEKEGVEHDEQVEGGGSIAPEEEAQIDYNDA